MKRQVLSGMAVAAFLLGGLGAVPATAGSLMPQPVGENFTGTVTMDSSELQALTDSERSELVGKKIVIENENADPVVLPGDDAPTEDPGTYATIESINDFPLSVNGPLSGKQTVSPMITKVTCGGRYDWYRLVKTSNENICFSNAGTYSPLVGITKVKGHCPGANAGRFGWGGATEGTYKYSYWAGPYPSSKYRTCVWLDNNATKTVLKVQIK